MYIYIATALIAAFASGVGVWNVQNWRYGAKENERMEAARLLHAKAEKTIDTASVGHEKDKAQLRTDFKPITETFTHVIREPFYLPSEQCLDADGLRVLTLATGARPAASEPAGAVPRPRTPD